MISRELIINRKQLSPGSKWKKRVLLQIQVWWILVLFLEVVGVKTESQSSMTDVKIFLF